VGRLPAGFFLPVRVLSRVFRGKLLAGLQERFVEGGLRFQGKLSPLAKRAAFLRRLAQARSKEWVVYAKPPFGGPERVLRYLARYTHRVAISNGRLVKLEGGKVSFRWKDYAHGHRPRTMTLEAVELLRRFLLHVLPKGFAKIRHYGILANRSTKLPRCRELLGAAPPVQAAEETSSDGAAPGAALGETRCPSCGSAALVVSEIPRPRLACRAFDSS